MLRNLLKKIGPDEAKRFAILAKGKDKDNSMPQEEKRPATNLICQILVLEKITRRKREKSAWI